MCLADYVGLWTDVRLGLRSPSNVAGGRVRFDSALLPAGGGGCEARAYDEHMAITSEAAHADRERDLHPGWAAHGIAAGVLLLTAWEFSSPGARLWMWLILLVSWGGLAGYGCSDFPPPSSSAARCRRNAHGATGWCCPRLPPRLSPSGTRALR